MKLFHGVVGQPFEWFTVEAGRFTQFGSGPVQVEAADLINLNCARILPGFVDAHCHILPTGLDLLKLHLGACGSHEQVLDAVRDWERTLPEGEWLHAVHYDQTKYLQGHLSAAQLDSISSKRPILLRHSNGHASVANSAALAAAGIHAGTPDPKGGEYVRDPGGNLTGVLLETAHEFVTNAAPTPNLDQMVEAILRAASAMRSYGITAASDMMTGRWNLLQELEAYRLASERGAAIRFTLCLQWATVLGPRAASSGEIQNRVSAMDSARCRIGGLKIFADGAMGSATAAIHGRFLTTGERGILIYDPERLESMIAKATEAGYSVAVHSIGDRSTDHVMDAFEASGEPARHRIEHVMLLSDAQIGRLARLGCHATMQPEFLSAFKHAYARQLGPEVAQHLKRARSVIDAGIPLSFNSDRPIVTGDPWIGIHNAVSRPEGYDPSENVTREEAFSATTKMGAAANGQPGEMGEFRVGAFADFQELGPDDRCARSYLGGGV